jgi:hypothetical protein
LQPKFKPIWPPSQLTDGQPIPSWGFIKKNVQFQGKLFTSTFLQAAVAGPILGIDFLRKFKVIVSPELSQIQFACSAAAPSAHILPPAAPPASYCSSSFSFRENKSLLDPPPLFKKITDFVPDDVKIILQKFPSILRTWDVKPTPNHEVEHHIHTGSHPPNFSKSHRLDPEKLQIAKAELKRLESAGIVRRSKSPWASPLHMVPKKDGLWRPCGDYLRLNLVTTPDKYPLPNMQDLSNGLHNCTIFFKN